MSLSKYGAIFLIIVSNLSGEVLALRDGSINIYDMISLYSLEDEALEKLEIAKAMVYNFDRQPFLDLR